MFTRCNISIYWLSYGLTELCAAFFYLAETFRSIAHVNHQNILIFLNYSIHHDFIFRFCGSFLIRSSNWGVAKSARLALIGTPLSSFSYFLLLYSLRTLNLLYVGSGLLQIYSSCAPDRSREQLQLGVAESARLALIGTLIALFLHFR